MFVPAHNVTDSPIVIDGEGRTLGGGEWGAVDRHDEVAQGAIGDGRLTLHPDLDPGATDVDQAAVDAHDEASLLEERRTHLANVDVDQLRTLARSGGLDDVADEAAVAHYEQIGKAVLRRRLVRRTDISLTSSPAAEPDLAARADEEEPPGSGPPAPSRGPAPAPAKKAAPARAAAKSTGGGA